jgi:hypothetical protein
LQLHGVNSHGKAVLRRQIHRGQMRGQARDQC